MREKVPWQSDLGTLRGGEILQSDRPRAPKVGSYNEARFGHANNNRIVLLHKLSLFRNTIRNLNRLPFNLTSNFR